MPLTKAEENIRSWYPERVGKWTRQQWLNWFKKSGILQNDVEMAQLHKIFEFADEPPYQEENEFGKVCP